MKKEASVNEPSHRGEPIQNTLLKQLNDQENKRVHIMLVWLLLPQHVSGRKKVFSEKVNYGMIKKYKVLKKYLKNVYNEL